MAVLLYFRVFFYEALLAAELVFTIFMLAKEKHSATFIAPVGIGLALFISEMAGVQFTGGSLNPARSFGPCVVTGTFDSVHWIYCKSPSPFYHTHANILRGWSFHRLSHRSRFLLIHQDS